MAKEKKQEEPYELHLSRTISASAASVYKAWVNPKLLSKWWGPKGFTSVCDIAVRPEGTIQITMKGPDGTAYPVRGIYHDVIANESLSFSLYSFDDDRRRAGLVNHHKVSFAEQEGVTTITLVVRVVRASPAVAGAVAGMQQGWGESLDRLTILLGD